MAIINGKALVKDGKPLDRVYSNGQLVYSRNYILNSSGMNASNTNRPAMYSGGAGTALANAGVTYNSDSTTLTYTGTGTPLTTHTLPFIVVILTSYKVNAGFIR